MIGTGGVGSGMFFAINGTQTLGREESRSGRILDRRDYCKLHIVSHYVKTLLGSGFEVIPIGRVGEDEAGRRLIGEMSKAGMRMEHMRVSGGEHTLFSFCFSYPDGSGGNFTTDDSASSRLVPEDVMKATETFKKSGRRGIGLALPEVPLETRTALLKIATENGLYRIASFTSNEMDAVKDGGLIGKIDHLAVNIDEASRLAGKTSKETPIEEIVDTAADLIAARSSSLSLSVTAGRSGSWVYDREKIRHLPVPEVDVVSTAGAGDAYLAGFIVGITAGLMLSEAQELATLVAALSVTSPHTINKEIDRVNLVQFVNRTGFPVSERLRLLLALQNQR